MKAGRYCTSVAVIVLFTGVCSAARGSSRTLLVFNPRSKTSLPELLLTSEMTGFSFKRDQSEQRQYPEFLSQYENFVDPGYLQSNWETKPPVSVTVTVKTYEVNTKDKPFVSQPIHQQTFDSRQATPHTWFSASRALNRDGSLLDLMVWNANDLFMYGVKSGSSQLYWVIVANRTDIVEGVINVILTSKLKKPPSYNVFSDDDVIPTFSFWERLTYTDVIKSYNVSGILQVTLSEDLPCIRVIHINGLDPTAFTETLISIQMFLGIDAPDVLWQMTLGIAYFGIPAWNITQFDSVVCPENMTIHAVDVHSLQYVPVTVTFEEVEGDYNIGKLITVKGYYGFVYFMYKEEETIAVYPPGPPPPPRPAPLQLTSPPPPPLQLTSPPPPLQLTSPPPPPSTQITTPSLVQTYEHPSQEQTTVQPSQEQTTVQPSQEQTTVQPSPQPTGETKTSPPCHDLPHNWNTQINSSTLQALMAEIAELKQQLAVNKSALSSTIRRKNSAPDMRVSSKIMGYVSGAILAVVFGGVVVADLPTLAKSFKLMKRNLLGK